MSRVAGSSRSTRGARASDGGLDSARLRSAGQRWRCVSRTSWLETGVAAGGRSRCKAELFYDRFAEAGYDTGRRSRGCARRSRPTGELFAEVELDDELASAADRVPTASGAVRCGSAGGGAGGARVAETARRRCRSRSRGCGCIGTGRARCGCGSPRRRRESRLVAVDDVRAAGVLDRLGADAADRSGTAASGGRSRSVTGCSALRWVEVAGESGGHGAFGGWCWARRRSRRSDADALSGPGGAGGGGRRGAAVAGARAWPMLASATGRASWPRRA